MTNHQCDELCKVGCDDKLCQKKAGHSGDHLCSDNHKCKDKCQVGGGCGKQCNLIFNHDEGIVHDCGNQHNCENKCKYCDNSCTKVRSDGHTEHQCSVK